MEIFQFHIFEFSQNLKSKIVHLSVHKMFFHNHLFQQFSFGFGQRRPLVAVVLPVVYQHAPNAFEGFVAFVTVQSPPVWMFFIKLWAGHGSRHVSRGVFGHGSFVIVSKGFGC